jgi:hypothetical protein
MGIKMKDVLIETAGGLAILIAVLHQSLAEMRLFPRIKPEAVSAKPLLRAVWLNGSIAWASIGILLMLSPTFGSQAARHWIVVDAVVVLGSAAIGNAWYFKWKHPGWVLLAVAIGLAIAGR